MRIGRGNVHILNEKEMVVYFANIKHNWTRFVCSLDCLHLMKCSMTDEAIPFNSCLYRVLISQTRVLDDKLMLCLYQSTVFFN